MKKLITLFLVLFSSGCLSNDSFDFNKEIQKQLEIIQKENSSQVKNMAEKPYPNLVVFVSLSMPESSLEGIIRQADKINAAVVIRGVLPQGFKATVNQIQKILIGNRTDPKDVLGGITIDPERFKQFSVDKVPTYVLVETGKCKTSKEFCDPSDYDKLQGNITPIAALNLFRNSGEHSKLADELLRE